MKKKTLIERKKALKEAYYNELKKRKVLTVDRKKLFVEAKELGITGYNKMKTNDLIKAIEDKKAELKALEEEKQALLNELKEMQELTEENFSMSNDELKALIEEVKNAPSSEGEEDGESDKEEGQEEPPVDGTVEDIEMPDITVEQVQAVANAIVDQSEEENKTIEQVVDDIVKESNEVSEE